MGLISFVLLLFFFGPPLVSIFFFAVQYSLISHTYTANKWWFYAILSIAVFSTVVAGLIYGFYLIVTKRAIRLEPEGLKIVRRPLPLGHLEFYPRGQIVGAEVGVPTSTVETPFGAVLLVLSTGERKVLLITQDRQDAASLAWEITDYYGFAPNLVHVQGLHESGYWYPVVNGQIDMSQVEPWPAQRVISEPARGWRVMVNDQELVIRACPWYRDLYQVTGVAAVLTFLLIWGSGIYLSLDDLILPFLGIFGVFMLFHAALKRTPRTRISADKVHTKNGFWEIGFSKSCKPEDIERVRYIPWMAPGDKTGKGGLFLGMTTRAQAADISYTAGYFKSPGQAAGLAQLVASRLPGSVPIGHPPEPVTAAQASPVVAEQGPSIDKPIAEPSPDRADGAAAQTEAGVVVATEVVTGAVPETVAGAGLQAGTEGIAQAMAPARDLASFQAFELKRRWPTVVLITLMGLLMSSPFLFFGYLKLPELILIGENFWDAVGLWVIGGVILLTSLFTALWLALRRSWFVLHDGRLSYQSVSMFGKQTRHEMDAEQVEGVWLLIAPGMNQIFQWPCYLCVKSAGRHSVLALGFWETANTTFKAMRQVRQALGIQLDEVEFTLGVVYRGGFFSRDEHNRLTAPSQVQLDPVTDLQKRYKRAGEHAWSRFALPGKWFFGSIGAVLLVLVTLLVMPMVLDESLILFELHPSLFLWTMIFGIVYLYKLLAAVEYESIQAEETKVTRFNIGAMSVKTTRISVQEIGKAEVFCDHRFTPRVGRYEVWFQLAVKDDLTHEPQLILNKIGSYEEAIEILNDLKAGAGRE